MPATQPLRKPPYSTIAGTALLSLALCTSNLGCLVAHTPPDSSAESGKVDPDNQETSSTQEGKGLTSQGQLPDDKSEEAGDSAQDTSSAPQGDEKAKGSPCSDDGDAVCLPKLPQGWRGPVQPQEASEPDFLAECTPGTQAVVGRVTAPARGPGPDASANVYVKQLERPPRDAQCTGCKAKLELGNCTPPVYRARYYNPTTSPQCGAVRKDLNPFPMASECHALQHFGLDDPRGAVSAVPPVPSLDKAECTLPDPGNSETEAPNYPAYFRFCEGRQEKSDCGSGKSCVRFDRRLEEPRLAEGCIYRPGRHSCPAGPYANKKLALFGKAVDSRGCDGCELKHTPGQIQCPYKMFISERDPRAKCEGARSIRAEELCLTRKMVDGSDPNSKAPYSVKYELGSPEYSGSCDTTPWKHVGSFQLTQEVTLCCTSI